MSDGSSWKPNWRNVWIGSAAVSAVLSALLVWSTGAPDDPAVTLQYLISAWAMFWVMLTVIGVLIIFRMMYNPGEEFAERQKLREEESKNSPVARATERTLRWLAKFRRKS